MRKFSCYGMWIITVILTAMVLSIGCSPPPPPPEVEEEFEVAKEGQYILDAYHEHDYSNTEANVKKGIGFLEIGFLDEAETEFKKAIAFDSKYVAAHINLGRTYLAKEMYHHALDSFNTAIQLDPTIAKTHYYRALAFEKLGKIEEAIESLRHALEMDANLTQASDMLQRLLGVSFEETNPDLGNLFVVSIYSEPSEASVTLNREPKGTTPLTLKMDLASINQLEVSKEGYVIDHQDINFKDDNTAEMTVVFTRSGERSSTVMTSSPGLRLVIDPIHFDFNSAVIKPMSYPTLNKAGQALLNFPEYGVAIEGHTDNVGSDEYNQRLSEQRAYAVAEYLARNFGIDQRRFRVAGYGENYPIADNNTETGRALNRRTEIIILTSRN